MAGYMYVRLWISNWQASMQAFYARFARVFAGSSAMEFQAMEHHIEVRCKMFHILQGKNTLTSLKIISECLVVHFLSCLMRLFDLDWIVPLKSLRLKCHRMRQK